MTSTAAPSRTAHFTVNLSNPSDGPALPSAECEQAGLPTRPRNKDGETGATGTAPATSAWAAKLYEQDEAAEVRPQRVAAFFERASQSFEQPNASPPERAAAGPNPPEAKNLSVRTSTATADARASKPRTSQPDTGTALSPPSMSMCSSELYKDLDEDGEGGAKSVTQPLTTVRDGEERLSSATAADSTSQVRPFSMSHAADRKIAWRCGVCGYFVLAMDQNGQPLPFAVSAFGEPLPLRCPRCQLEHTAWEQDVPFDRHGDHVNVRSKLSNNYVLADEQGANGATSGRRDVSSGTDGAPGSSSSPLAAATARYEKTFLTNNTSLFRYNLLSSLADTHQETAHKPGQTTSAAGTQRLLRDTAAGNHRANALSRLGLGMNSDGEFNLLSSLPRAKPTHAMAYYCGLCNRRLLRVDAQGELVPMDCDENGQVLPIVCPGCGESHNNWVVKPFAARNNAPTGKRLY